MSIPDYIITRTVLDEQMHRQFTETPNPDLPEPRHRARPDRFATIRRQLSAALHAAADRIEPRPIDPAPGSTG